MANLTCKGYTAIVEADPGTGWIHGAVMNIPALLTIAGCSMDDLKAAFALAVADYEDRYHVRHKAPEVPRSQMVGRRVENASHLP
jgi:predicted HicB family RNase H-like nuclease